MFQLTLSFRLDEEKPTPDEIEKIAGRAATSGGHGAHEHGPFRLWYDFCFDDFGKAVNVRRLIVAALVNYVESEVRVTIREL